MPWILCEEAKTEWAKIHWLINLRACIQVWELWNVRTLVWEIDTYSRHIVAPEALIKKKSIYGGEKEKKKKTHEFEFGILPTVWLLIFWTSPRLCVQQTTWWLLNCSMTTSYNHEEIFMKINIPFNTYHISSQYFVYQKVLEQAPKLFISWQMLWPLSKELGSNLCSVGEYGSGVNAGGRESSSQDHLKTRKLGTSPATKVSIIVTGGSILTASNLR